MNLHTVAHRSLLALSALALAGWLCGPAAAQTRMPDIPTPGGEQPQDPPSAEGEDPQDPEPDPEGWDGAGEGPGAEAPVEDERRIMTRRRPRLRVVPKGPDLRLEFEFNLLVNGLDGDGHDAAGIDYNDLFSAGSGAGFRVAFPMRFHRTASRISLMAGPLFVVDGAGFDGSAFTLPNQDVIIADDMTVTRVGFGGIFRADFGRFYVEPWFSIGSGHVSKTDATYDTTFNGGNITTIELYKESTVGHVQGAIRGGLTFWPTDAISIAIFGEIGGWATGAPDPGALSPLGDPNPGSMVGFRGAFGVSISFGLGDFQGNRTAARTRAAPPRRPLAGDF